MGLRERSIPFLCIAALASAGRAAGACVDLDSLGNGVRDDGGASPVEAAAPDAADPCEHVGPVARPAAASDPGSLPPFVVGVHEIVFDPTEVPGFDIDGVCTCDTRPGTRFGGIESCVRSTRSKSARCDLKGGVGGIDNALGELAGLIQAQNQGSTRFDAFAMRLIDQGRRTLLVQISEYNGLADDDEVTVSLLLSNGLPSTDCDASTPEAGALYAPGWCGGDRWRIMAESVVGDFPLVFAKGYVNGFQLVARFDAAKVQVPFSESADLVMHQATLSGTLVPLSEGLREREAGTPPTPGEQRLWRLKGLFAGRTATNEALGAIGTVKIGGSPLCKQGSTFDVAVQTVCAAVDVDVAGNDDGGAPCDGLSVAIGFTADPVLKGSVDDGGLPTDECTPGAVGAPEYTCP